MPATTPPPFALETDQPSRPTAARKADGPAVPNGGKVVQKRQKEPAIPDRGKKVQKRQKEAEAALIMMEKYLDVRTKQVEGEVAEKSRAESRADEYSKKCMSVIKTMVELTGEEKAEAFDVFKDAQNQEIFMNADSPTRLIWTRKKCMEAQRKQGN